MYFALISEPSIMATVVVSPPEPSSTAPEPEFVGFTALSTSMTIQPKHCCRIHENPDSNQIPRLVSLSIAVQAAWDPVCGHVWATPIHLGACHHYHGRRRAGEAMSSDETLNPLKSPLN
jgi:hypothetical protein